MTTPTRNISQISEPHVSHSSCAQFINSRASCLATAFVALILTGCPRTTKCVSGTASCDGDQAVVCGAAGELVRVGAPCSGDLPICSGGACVACRVGATRCSDTGAIQTCSSGGSWDTPVHCASGTPSCRDGQCECPAGKDACGAGTCVDTQVDINNCGGCGVVCQNTALSNYTPNCSLGRCVTAFARGDGISGIFTYRGSVFYMNCGRQGRSPPVFSVVKSDGSTARNFGELNWLACANSFVVDDKNFYLAGRPRWPDDLSSVVSYVTMQDGTETVLATYNDTEPVKLVGVVEGYVIWVRAAKLISAPMDGGAPRTLDVPSIGNANETMTAMDSLHVFWLSGRDLWTAPIAGGTPSILASGPSNGRYLTTDGTNVFWDDDDQNLFKVPVEGGPIQRLATAEGQLLVDATHVYFGRLSRVAISGGEAQEIARPVRGMWMQATAIDDSGVYWVDSEFGIPSSDTIAKLTPK